MSGVSTTPAARAALVIVTAVASLMVPATGAYADSRTALQKCQQGAAPDASQTVTHAGNQVGVSYPDVHDPDNAIFPGDVVRVTVWGNVSYNTAGNAAGPNGLGITAPSGWPFPGMNQVSSVARWNNNPGGWVGSPMPTTSLSGCNAAPSGYPVRLLYYINDYLLSDNGGQWYIRTDVFRAPGRLAIDGVEFTQGIQTQNNEIPLLHGKRTFVRVYVRGTDDGLGPLSGVSAKLTVEGQTRVYTPIGNATITASLSGSDRRSLTNSFLFEIDWYAIQPGTRRVTVTVTPPANRGGGWPIVRTTAVSFGPTNGVLTGIQIFGARYSYYNVPPAMQTQLGLTGSWWQARPVSAWEPQRQTAQNLLPMAHLAITELAPNEVWGSVYLDCKAVLGGDGRWGCAGYLDGRTWASNTIDARCPNGGCWIAVLQPEISDGAYGAYWTTARGNRAINLQGERLPINQGLTLAHEIGHGMSLPHTWEDAAFPRANGGMGPFIGLRHAPGISLVSGQDPAGNTTAYDVMSYSSPLWISPYNYCKALAVSTRGALTCPSSVRG